MFSNSKRKAMATSLAIVMTLGSVFSIGTTSYAEEKQDLQAVETTVLDAEQVNAAEGEIIIHAKGTGLKIYAWIDKEELFGAWPGQAMEADSTMGSGWYSATISNSIAKFIIHDGGSLKTEDTQKDAGEYWFVDGTFTDHNPEGPTQEPTTPPSATPRPVNELVDIASVSPEEGFTFKVDEPATISANVTGASDIKFYKYEVKFNGKYVSDYYYSTKDQYTFTPTEVGDYTVTVYAQAHDMDNTTESITLSYKVATDGNVVTPVPDEPTEVPDQPTQNPDQPTQNPDQPTQNPDQPTQDPDQPTQDPDQPTQNPDQPTQAPDQPTQVPDQPTQAPDQPTQAPDQPTKTPDQPTKTPDQPTKTPDQPTNRPTSQPATSQPTNKPTTKPTTNPSGDGYSDSLALKTIKTDKKSSQKVGSKIKITANATGGQGSYRYSFTVMDSNKKLTTLSKNSKQSYIYWTPTKAGKYTIKASVSDQSGDFDTKTMKYTITDKTLKIKSLKYSNKSNKKVRFKASVTGGTQKTYYFYAVRNGKKVFKRGYSTKNNVTWKMTKKGKYTIYVKVKDKVTGDVKKKKITYRVK